MLCQTTPLFELDDDTNHFSCYTSKNISKAEQQLRKSSGICCCDFFPIPILIYMSDFAKPCPLGFGLGLVQA